MANKRRHGQGTLYKCGNRGPWRAAWYDHTGKRRDESTHTTDRAAAERILAKRVADTALRRDGVIDARMDQYAQADRRPLADHVADWKAALLAKGGTLDHAALSENRVRSIIDDCKLERLTDVTPSVVQAYLARRRADGLSAASSNHYLRAIKGFCRWMVRDGRARDNALAHVSLLNEKADRRHERRALTADELRKLIDAAVHGPAWRGIDGRDRAMLYRVAALTGLRLAELRSLTVASFALADNPPTLTVKAAYSKRRREDTLPIRDELADALRDYFAGKLPTAGAFRTPARQHASIMFRADLAAAGIAYRDDAGRVVDFHALRHTFITALARGGVHPKVAQSLARHSTITLTMDRYSHTVMGELSDALATLPDLDADRTDSSQQRATGTDGKASGDDARTGEKHLQQYRQQCGRFSVRDGATRCDEVEKVPDSRHVEKPNVYAAACDSVRRGATLCDTTAAYPSGSRGRIANPLFVGSNPTAAFPDSIAS
jgi:integrase/recombinase XerD